MAKYGSEQTAKYRSERMAKYRSEQTAKDRSKWTAKYGSRQGVRHCWASQSQFRTWRPVREWSEGIDSLASCQS